MTIIFIRFLLIICLVLGVFFLPKKTFALSISPSLHELELEPGERVERQFEILNNESTELILRLQAADVRFSQSGVPQFLKSDKIAPDSLLWWLSFDSEPLLLKPNEKKAVKFSLSVPKNASPGGHYASILLSKALSKDGQKDQTAVAVKSELAALIYVNVAGEVKRSFNIQGFRTNKGIYESLPIEFNFSLGNDGNTHIEPHGIIQIFNFQGKEIGKIIVNESSSYLYPKQTKEFKLELNNFTDASPIDLFFGQFKAKLNINTAGSEFKSQEIGFLILPIRVIFISVAVLVFLVIAFIVYHKSLIRKTKKV